MSDDAEQFKRAERAHKLAVLVGYNELAKHVKTLGERVWNRMMRDRALAAYREAGGEIEMTENEDAILTIHLDALLPHLEFRERDIEMMRVCVANYDAARGREENVNARELSKGGDK